MEARNEAKARPPKPLKEKVSITIDGDLIEEIRYLAEEDSRSVSQYINMVLRSHVKRVKQRKTSAASQGLRAVAEDKTYKA